MEFRRVLFRSGDSESLQSVTITSLPSAGILTFNGAAVTAGQGITAVNISGGKLVFTPSAGGSGSPYTSFQFSVNDGTASSGTGTKSVQVTPVAPSAGNNNTITT